MAKSGRDVKQRLFKIEKRNTGQYPVFIASLDAHSTYVQEQFHM